ncbi:uncharacterized protein ACN2A1_008971 isoform 1-T2 [Glossina fuscipes fuscipes]
MKMLKRSAASCFRICRLPNCIWNDIACSYATLLEKHIKSLTRRQRLWHLAKPREYTPKFGQYQKPFFEALQHPKTTIIRTYENERESTRTIHLAYPKVSRLSILKHHTSYSSFVPQRKENVDRLIKKSLLSLYSHLSKAKLPPEQKTQIVQNIEENLKYVEGLAIPKKDHSEIVKDRPPPSTKKRRLRFRKPPLVEFNRPKKEQKPHVKRIDTLSRPKMHYTAEQKEWQLTPALKKYTPSSRLKNMAQPKNLLMYYRSQSVEKRIARTALRYEATDRIKQLAKSKRHYNRKHDGLKSSSAISPNALKAIATERTIRLAKPKIIIDMNAKSEPFKVRRRALRAHANEYIRNLAIPKHVRTKYMAPLYY